MQSPKTLIGGPFRPIFLKNLNWPIDWLTANKAQFPLLQLPGGPLDREICNGGGGPRLSNDLHQPPEKPGPAPDARGKHNILPWKSRHTKMQKANKHKKPELHEKSFRSSLGWTFFWDLGQLRPGSNQAPWGGGQFFFQPAHIFQCPTSLTRTPQTIGHFWK